MHTNVTVPLGSDKLHSIQNTPEIKVMETLKEHGSIIIIHFCICSPSYVCVCVCMTTNPTHVCTQCIHICIHSSHTHIHCTHTHTANKFNMLYFGMCALCWSRCRALACTYICMPLTTLPTSPIMPRYSTTECFLRRNSWHTFPTAYMVTPAMHRRSPNH